MILYNIICVLLSVVATGLLFYGVWVADHMYSYVENWYVLQGLALYTISKNVELLDTLFMILRRKWRQVSFLHVSYNRYIRFPELVYCLYLVSICNIYTTFLLLEEENC